MADFGVVEGIAVPKKKARVRKPKNYGDLCWNSQAKVGDVVYLPSDPNVKMTVQELCRYNYTANHSDPEVVVTWLSPTLDPITHTFMARVLLLQP